ncbi:hypothetical protein [Marinimicrobium sp. ABcell2]|uniref:hypothetical protein n=1 Tax=Marinimicrobium sp. ABcell2 TaxID=3069751 RepID=UPI0027ADC8EB|nr:hypothetical protein [Marinimicrobium sp. ABcell2]MDQ2078421.1 hypothetical protein [Marinimicrobium sp. ABcell2]
MKNTVTLCLLLIALSGCSSIVSKSEYSVAIASTPDEARFVITNRQGQKVHSGVTPSSITLNASAGYFKPESYTVVFTKEGYADKTFTLSSTIDGWYFGNIMLGGVIGMLIVDPATGAMYKLPPRVDVSLEGTVSEARQDELTIATLEEVPEQLRHELIKIN